jgi:hypothetical protein
MPVGWALAVVVIAVALVVLAVLMLGVLRQVAPLLEAVSAQLGASPGHQSTMRLPGLTVGNALPPFTARDAQGKVTNDNLRGRSVILAFLSAGCRPCQLIAGQLAAEGTGDLTGRLLVVTAEGEPAALGLPPDVPTLIEDNHEVSDALTLLGTPFAIAVDAEGTVRGMTVPNTRADLAQLAALLG